MLFPRGAEDGRPAYKVIIKLAPMKMQTSVSEYKSKREVSHMLPSTNRLGHGPFTSGMLSSNLTGSTIEERFTLYATSVKNLVK